MIDPVSGFSYPEAWVARCTDEAKRSLAESGFGVLTANGSVLRRGFTTGTTAAAAVYAAVASLSGAEVTMAPLLLPCGVRAEVPVSGRNGYSECRKFSGDYPDDVTAGILICAEARTADVLSFETGEGVGRFVRDTPRYALGEPAIGRQARACIFFAIEEGCRAAGVAAAAVTLRIPDGEKIGARTLNPKVGVLGGISVVGTTGFVEPWDDHLEETVAERIRSAKQVVITTGRIGLRYSRLLFPEYEVVLAGSKISEALAAARFCQEAVLCGLPGLILRFFHPETATSRGFATVEEMVASSCGSDAVTAELAGIRERYPWLRVVLVDRDGEILGDTGVVTAPVTIVGAGCGEGMLTGEAAAKLRSARLVYGSARAIEIARPCLPKDAVVCEIEDYADLRSLPQGSVVLSTGDPLMAGLGYLPGVVVPGISSLQVAFARLKVPWTNVAVVNAHGKDHAAAVRRAADDVRAGHSVFIIADPAFSVQELAAALAAVSPDIRIAVCEDLGYSSERVAEGTALCPPEVRSRLFCVVAGY